MAQDPWALTPNKSDGDVVTASEWNALAMSLRALTDRTTSASSTGGLPIGIDIANGRVYVGGTPEDASHPDVTLSVTGAATVSGVLRARGTVVPKITASSSAPSSPSVGDIWLDTS